MITYTDEMRKQDKLWETADEDLDKMGELYEEIMLEAIEKGFKGTYVIYNAINEKVIDLHLDNSVLGEDEPDASFGFCRPLIQWLKLNM